MNTNQEHIHVAVLKEQRDNADGWDRGYTNPYPKDKEKTILANIEKVSPAFVKGYWQGKIQANGEDNDTHYEGDWGWDD